VFPLAEPENKMSYRRTSAASFIAGRNGAPSSNDSQATQYSDSRITFHYEFALGSPPEIYPPGQYEVETAEEIHERNGHSARVCTSTLLTVRTRGRTRSVQVEASELKAVLEADGARHQLSATRENKDGSDGWNAPHETVEAEGLESQLLQLGIERVPSDIFVWQGYRYTNAKDAVAAATRARKA